MISICGDENTREYSAAATLRELIARVWPSTISSRDQNIHVVAGAKCHGQRRRDIDLLVIANFSQPMPYTPFLPFSGFGQPQSPDSVEIESLFVAIELKDHLPNQVRFVGTHVEVSYQGRWKDATEQNDEQIYSIKNFLQSHRLRAPKITPLIWLRNVPNTQLPPRPHNIIGANATWELFLNVMGQTSPPILQGGRWILTASSYQPSAITSAAELFTKVVQPTRLDRVRMELVSQRVTDLAEPLEILGQKLLVLRGRGGTGKTIRLLQLAKHLSEQEGARVLVLTYNKALVADIRRLLTILGVSDNIVGSTIQIRTLHSFLYEVMLGLGIIHKGYETFLDNYEQLKAQTLELIIEGVASQEDIEKLTVSNYEAFQWDYVFIDEGQDWPDDERELLLRIYPYNQVVIADGLDQLIRGMTHANWRTGLSPSQTKLLSSRTSLRMKTNLARFVSLFAQNIGLMGIEWTVNEHAPGGRVIIVEGCYFHTRELHDRLISENRHDRNSPVDMLFSVPPQMVKHLPENGNKHSQPASFFQQWGYQVWDGVSEDVREGYPTEIDQLRIVQYESCRGLEGWVVVNFGLDQFYEHKLKTYEKPIEQEAGILQGDSSPAHLYAARWLLIPMTRAMDTLVIQISKEDSPVRTALLQTATEYSDFVEWLTIPV